MYSPCFSGSRPTMSRYLWNGTALSGNPTSTNFDGPGSVRSAASSLHARFEPAEAGFGRVDAVEVFV